MRKTVKGKPVSIYLEPDVQAYLEEEGGYSPAVNRLIKEHKDCREAISTMLKVGSMSVTLGSLVAIMLSQAQQVLVRKPTKDGSGEVL